MVMVRAKIPLLEDGSVDINQWLHGLPNIEHYHLNKLKDACALGQIMGEDQAGVYGESSFHQGLKIAEILTQIDADQDTVIAGLLYPSFSKIECSKDQMQDHVSTKVATLIDGVKRMEAIDHYYESEVYLKASFYYKDNLRKMLLAMVQDIRVVFIKLAEYTYLLHSAQFFSKEKQLRLAAHSRDIYAPLANRLGLNQIKWELEDLSFRYLEPEKYASIAKALNEKRLDREARVKRITEKLELLLKEKNIKAKIQGRAKHIFSIYRKMCKKNSDFQHIYDAIALRILVNSIEDCYEVLSLIRNHWEHIPTEFDDYISVPKSNGYQSIHEVLYDIDRKPFEIQIRTFKMHEESERGVAAHWVYKEGKKTQHNTYERKIALLRQLLDWHKEMSGQQTEEADLSTDLFNDRVYVFTPKGDIIDLAAGSTPLDFAYHIHTDIGHRCRGGKINDKIVPLTYVLQNGDRVDILTGSKPQPSRDWLSSSAGYLKTSRARAKVHHWFKEQDYDKHVATGQELLEKELKRLHIENISFDNLAERFSYKSKDDFFASLGNGDLRMGQILHYLQETILPKKEPELPTYSNKAQVNQRGSTVSINGMGNLLSHIAKCCQPLPGDNIIGYITRGRGVSIHRRDCSKVADLLSKDSSRLLEIAWNKGSLQKYEVNLGIHAFNRPGILKDITQIFASEKTDMLSINTFYYKNENEAHFKIKICIDNLSELSLLIDKLQQIPNILSAKREAS